MKYLKKLENKKLEKIIEYHDNGNIKFILYRLYSLFHREDGPAYQSWYYNGRICAEYYYLNNKYHRLDGPAYQYWYENGQKKQEVYYINDLLHREDGPAAQYWDINLNVNLNKILYFLNGVKYEREEWLEELKKMNSPHYEEQKELYELEQNMEKYNL